MENMTRVQRAVKSICEKDPGWWVAQRLKRMAAQSAVNDRIRCRRMPAQRVNEIRADVAWQKPAESGEPRSVEGVRPRMGRNHRLVNSVFAGRRG